MCKERADCVFLCYDITQLDTFNSVKEWFKTFKLQSTRNVLFYLIGCKNDLAENLRAIDRSTAQAFSRTHGISKFSESSALEIRNAEQIFRLAATHLYQANKTAGSSVLRLEKFRVSLNECKEVSNEQNSHAVTLSQQKHAKLERAMQLQVGNGQSTKLNTFRIDKNRTNFADQYIKKATLAKTIEVDLVKQKQ